MAATGESIQRQIDQLKARLAAVQARDRERARKRDGRCKAILGGALVARVQAGDRQAGEVYRALRAGLDGRTAAAFEGWEGPPAGGGARGGEVVAQGQGNGEA